MEQRLYDSLVDGPFFEVGVFRRHSSLDGAQLPCHELVGTEKMAGKPVDQELEQGFGAASCCKTVCPNRVTSCRKP